MGKSLIIKISNLKMMQHHPLSHVGVVLPPAEYNLKPAVYDAEKYLQIVEGFLEGAVNATNFDDLKSCIKDGETVVQDAENAYTHFRMDSLSGAIDGVKDIASAIEGISDALADCSTEGPDLDKLKQIAKEFKHPLTFAWTVGNNIVHNEVDISNDVNTAIADWKDSKWEDFGMKCGDAAAKVFLGNM